MLLAILDVSDDPTLEFTAQGPTGVPLRARVFSGQCRIGKSPDHKFTAQLSTGARIAQLGFYVPQAGPLRASYQLSAWAEVSLASMRIAAGGLSQQGPYGVENAAVQMVEDDKGLGGQWPYLWFTAHGGEPIVMRYRVTVTEPVD